MKTRAELVRCAHAQAASMFVGKRKLPKALIEKARHAAFAAIVQCDRTAGTSDHTSAAYSYGVVALANEGVDEAIESWSRIWGRSRK